jgi:hypothetical protein
MVAGVKILILRGKFEQPPPYQPQLGLSQLGQLGQFWGGRSVD